eukprot:CAMPEP_0175164338 /NCGR_PEP_ID=MMETSP0087-20121206/26352_1 /TAXON_ID=136419 /ORGANISM="Unknown Unknown, Strain D1" /LENGTH=51 /DNA_ID=CAMNT_0016453347 /DNA_START=9 /DNA_END=164 /DNA_ORIENTATION=-
MKMKMKMASRSSASRSAIRGCRVLTAIAQTGGQEGKEAKKKPDLAGPLCWG